MSWKRSGYCCRCGACCRGDPFGGGGEWCPLLRFHVGAPEGDTTCVGHIGYVPAGQENNYYMTACLNWPDHPDQLADKPNCTYTFEWVNDGG